MKEVCNRDRHREKNVLPTKGNDVSRIMDEFGVYLRLAWLKWMEIFGDKMGNGTFCRVGVNCGRP